MTLPDIFSLIHWWFIIFIIGIVFLPFTITFFPNFFDKGYVFSKTIGLSILSYTLFVLGISHILPFSTIGCWVVLLFWGVLLYINPNRLRIKKPILTMLLEKKKIIFWEEVLCLLCIFVLAYIRNFNPDVHGLEKYMDFGFINSILRTKYFPPIDMWFPPFSINYYYFGHIMTAVLTKLSGIPSNITFNLMLATIFSFTFTLSFSIAANLIYFLKRQLVNKIVIAGGLLSAFLVTLSGNLHVLYAFFSPYKNDYPMPPWTLTFQPFSFPNSYWYPNATRFIYHTIHEFPIYSWTVSDLHGHVLDIPFVLTTVALLLSMTNCQWPMTKATKLKTIFNWSFSIYHLALLSFLLAVMYMTNAWDGAIYFLLSALVLIAIKIKSQHTSSKTFFYSLCTIVVSAMLFTLPYSIFFKPFASGIGVLCAPTFLTKIGKVGPFLFEPNACQHSPWWQLLILYSFFLFFVVSFLLYVVKNRFVFFKKQSDNFSDVFILTLIILSIVLIILPEFVYLKDIYPTYYRANTMFKLVFQAFMLLSLSSGYIFVRFAGFFKEHLYLLRTKSQRLKTTLGLALWIVVALCLIGLVSIYPFIAINSYYGNLQISHGIDGTKYLQTLYPGDYSAINWINKNISGQPVILEAQGDSYTDYARISSNTGLPTVLGWTVHEWLWRGTYDIPSPRIAEVQNMYTSPDINVTKQLLQKYHVAYIYSGALEKQKYPTLDEIKFKQLGKIVYQNPTVRIYKVN